MNAGRLLRETGYDTDALRVRLAPIDPDRVNVWPASPIMKMFWRSGVRGVTMWKGVFVDRELFSGDRDRLARLVIHELVHVRQFHDAGYVGFSLRYATDYITGLLAGKSGRQAYLDIPAEVEARELTKRIVDSAS